LKIIMNLASSLIHAGYKSWPRLNVQIKIAMPNTTWNCNFLLKTLQSKHDMINWQNKNEFADHICAYEGYMCLN
jgi:hypothetical protein